jgi:tetratricopeptide (TPR) repeat protein
MNRPRAWEEKLLLAHEKPKERGIRVVLRNPVTRAAGLVVLGIGLCAALFFGVILPRQSHVAPTITNTPGPSPTFTATPTLFGATAEPPKIATGPTPLSAFLQATYTPTPLYVNTPQSAGAIDQFRIAKAAYEKGDWDAFLQNMELVKQMEPDRADVYYYIGEGYRFKGDTGAAAGAYNDAIDIDPNFGPPYLGLARVRLMSNPKFNAETLFKQAIQHDPNFGEAYLERARYYINHDKIDDALNDLATAEKLLPGSPEVYLTYANAYVASDDLDKALEYAQKAYSADIVNMPTYKLLGDLYIQKEDYGNAAEALRVYTAYQTDDAVGFAKLSEAYYRLGEYQNAVNALNSGTSLNPKGLRQYYVYRGLSQLELGNAKDAVSDLEVAVDEDDQSFEARLGLARAYYLDNKFGSAFLQIEVVKSLAETDEEKALGFYWRAKIQEKRNDIGDAIQAWQDLLKLDKDVMTPEMRAEAEARIKVLVPPTRTLTPTKTPRGGASTSTPTTVTGTPKPNMSPTPSRTPTSTPSRTPTPTP